MASSSSSSTSSAPRCITVFLQVDFEGYISAQKRTKKASQLNVIFDDGQVASLPVKTHERYKKRGKAVASEVSLAGALFNAAVCRYHPISCHYNHRHHHDMPGY